MVRFITSFHLINVLGRCALFSVSQSAHAWLSPPAACSVGPQALAGRSGFGCLPKDSRTTLSLDVRAKFIKAFPELPSKPFHGRYYLWANPAKVHVLLDAVHSVLEL